MAIEFILDPDQRRLRAAAREIAHDVLAGVSAGTAGLASPEERFAATRPAYQRLVEAGYLRKVLPESAGGELRSPLDLALIAEELTAVDASVALTLSARGRYVIGNGMNPTVAELTQAAAAAVGAPGADPGSDDEARARLGDYFAEVLLLDQGTDAARARAELGWHPRYPSLSDEFRHGSYRN